MYLVFTRMPGETYRRRLRSLLLCLCDVYRYLSPLCSDFEYVPLAESMYLVFTRMQVETYRRRLRSLLLCLCDVFRTLISPLVC